MSCLYSALETMPIGTAYAVWTGIGAAGSALVGIGLFGESATALRMGSLALVTVGRVRIGLSSRWKRPRLLGAGAQKRHRASLIWLPLYHHTTRSLAAVRLLVGWGIVDVLAIFHHGDDP